MDYASLCGLLVYYCGVLQGSWGRGSLRVCRGVYVGVCIFSGRVDGWIVVVFPRWYFGAIARQEAEEILRNCSEGSYVVRACELLANRRDFSLAIKWVAFSLKCKLFQHHDTVP